MIDLNRKPCTEPCNNVLGTMGFTLSYALTIHRTDLDIEFGPDLSDLFLCVRSLSMNT